MNNFLNHKIITRYAISMNAFASILILLSCASSSKNDYENIVIFIFLSIIVFFFWKYKWIFVIKICLFFLKSRRRFARVIESSLAFAMRKRKERKNWTNILMRNLWDYVWCLLCLEFCSLTHFPYTRKD